MNEKETGTSPLSEFVHGVSTLVRKELLIILKDKRGRLILVAPIIIMTILFGYVATYDLNCVEYALLDEDHSTSSRELARRFDNAPIFHRVATLHNAGQIATVIETKKAGLVLHIGPDFERKLNLGQSAPVQVLTDGRNSNVAGTAASYANEMVNAFNAVRLRERGIDVGGLNVTWRAWFNPNLETRWGILSGLIATMAVIQVLSLASGSVAREREAGTFDQLLVTPMGPMTLMMGKAVAPVLVGLVQATLVLIVSITLFAIPFAGSYILLYLCLILFNFAIVGVGLCISVFSSNQQQSMLYGFTIIMPMILLSGFATPISSMPDIMQWATYVNPVRYAVDFSQRIYLEGAGIRDIWPDLWPLAIIAIVTNGAASRLFRNGL